MSEINTIYIISKGRPECTTAKTLEKIGYPGEWFIVCGNNDETLPEYRENWGEHVLVFDWFDEITRTDTLDNFGFENMASGAVPVRNATCDIARARGERRHWQLDDDYYGFYRTIPGTMKKEHLDGQGLYDTLLEVAEFADECKLNNCGIGLTTIESVPQKARMYSPRVFNAHNLPTDPELFTRWRGRMNDDLINAIETYRNGGFELSFYFASISMKESQQEQGGLTDLYKAEGTVRKTAYPVLVAPNAVQLVPKYGRYHHRVVWKRLVPKMLNEKWAKSSDAGQERHDIGKRQPRVAFIGFMTFGADGRLKGGTEVMNHYQMLYFKSRGYKVRYFSTWKFSDKRLKSYEEEYGCECFDIDGLLNSDEVRRFHPDLIFISGLFGKSNHDAMTRVAKSADGVPVIIYSHGINVSQTKKVPTQFLGMDNVFWTTLNQGDYRDRLEYGIPESRIFPVVNMLDIGDAETIRHDYEFDIASNARFVPQKGVKNVAKLCSKAGFEAAFVGQGATGSTEYFKKEAELLGDKAHYFGVVQRELVFDIIGKSRFVAYFPNSEEGGSPLALLEAMALGTPIITWDAFGVANCVNREHNIVLEHDKHFVEQFMDEYYPRLGDYLTDENRRSLSEETQSRFGKEAYYRQLDEIIESVMSGEGNGETA